MCFEMVFSSIYSIIFPGIEVRLAGLLFSGPFFLPALKTGGAFTFFQCLSAFPDHNKVLKTIKSGIRLTSASSTPLVGALHQVVCVWFKRESFSFEVAPMGRSLIVAFSRPFFKTDQITLSWMWPAKLLGVYSKS